MKKEYLRVEIDLITLGAYDILTTSGGGEVGSGDSGALDGGSTDSGWTEPVYPW